MHFVTNYFSFLNYGSKADSFSSAKELFNHYLTCLSSGSIDEKSCICECVKKLETHHYLLKPYLETYHSLFSIFQECLKTSQTDSPPHLIDLFKMTLIKAFESKWSKECAEEFYSVLHLKTPEEQTVKAITWARDFFEGILFLNKITEQAQSKELLQSRMWVVSNAFSSILSAEKTELTAERMKRQLREIMYKEYSVRTYHYVPIDRKILFMSSFSQ